jgi:outer membrane protein W
MGFSFAGRFDVNDKIAVGASLGYHINSYENLGGHITEYVMPVLGMLEYRFGNDGFVPYVGGNMGLYRFGAFGNDGVNTAGYFGLAPSAGFDYNISPAVFLHGCMYYHYILTQGVRISAFGFDAGIGIKF